MENLVKEAHGRRTEERSSAAEGAPGCQHRERSCQKLLFPSRQMCAEAKGWKRRGEGTILKVRSVLLRRAAHVTEVEQTEREDGGRKEKPMTISSACHSQGSPCAPHTPLGPKAGPVLISFPSSPIFTHVTESGRGVLQAAVIHFVMTLLSKPTKMYTTGAFQEKLGRTAPQICTHECK